MKFNFTEGAYEGAFRFGGKLEVTAQGAQEVQALVDHFRLFKDMGDVKVLQARIEALQSETLSHTIQADKRPVYEVESCLDHEFTEPYKKWARDNFGYEGAFPDLEIPREWRGLKYTNYQARLFTENEHICYKVFVTSEPWNKRDAQDYATHQAQDYIAEEFGARRHEPEFIHLGNGMAKPNPNYLKRHKPHASASNARLKQAFFAWWLANHATDAQKAIVAGNAQIVSETGGYMGAFNFERQQYEIYHGRKLAKDGKTQDYKSVSFAEFAAMARGN